MTTVDWTRDAAAHLLRRAGFGGTPSEIDDLFARGLEGAVSRLVDYESIDLSAYEQSLAAKNHGALHARDRPLLRDRRPHFVVGDAVLPGIYGGPPNLASLDSNGNRTIVNDFRSYYGTILQDWLGADSAAILGNGYPNLGFLNRGCV
jgi:hypothetical protein